MKAISIGTFLLVLGIINGEASAQIERISVASNGTQANADSYTAQLSDDGTVVVFRSNADNLVAKDTNDWSDIFVRDLTADSTEIASLSPDGTQGTYALHPTVSDDGQLVLYEGRAKTNVAWPTLFNRTDDSVTQFLPRLAPGGAEASPQTARNEPQISGNGQFVLFHTRATLQNLFDPDARPINDDNNSSDDVFVFNRLAQPVEPIERVSRDTGGNTAQGDSLSGSLSDDGRFVAFFSYAITLVANDANGHEDVFVVDRNIGTIELISSNLSGTSGNADSYNPTISGNGQFVVFRSAADDLVADDLNGNWDIFVRDRGAQTTERVSVASNGAEANNHSFEPSISDDGRYVVFRSLASNLVPVDTNQRADIFVHDRDLGVTARVSEGAQGEADGNSWEPAISGNGQWIVFESDATNLVTDDTNRARDIFRAPNPLFQMTRTGQVGGRHE